MRPGPDFERAGDLIRDRTGTVWTYNPHDEPVVAARVEELLTGGLTVEEAVQLALLNNRGLQSAFQDIGVSRAEVVQSRLLTNPTLSLMFRLPESGGRLNSEYALAQEIADLWQIPVRRRMAEAQLQAVILGVAQQAVDLAADVRVRAFELLALQEGEAALRESLTLVERSLGLAEHQLAAGSASQLDVNLARANVIEIRIELILLERDRKTAETALARLMMLSDGSRPWRLEDRLPEPGDRQAGNLLLVAVGQRLDARRAEIAARQAEFELRLQARRVFPSLQIGFNTEVQARQSFPGRDVLADAARASIANGAPTIPEIQSRGQRAMERRQIIDAVLGPTVALTLPIWDQNQAQVASARFLLMQRRKEYEDVLDRVASEVQRAAIVAESAESLVRFYQEEALPQAQIGVEGAQRVYQAGQQSILALIQAQGSYVLRRRAFVRALGEYAVATAELERAIGGRRPSTHTQPATRPE